MLNKFIICLCDGDIKELVKDGDPPIQVLYGHWEKIYLEYIHICGIDNINEVHELHKKINSLNGKIHWMHAFIENQQARCEIGAGWWWHGLDIIKKFPIVVKALETDSVEDILSKLEILYNKAKNFVIQRDDAIARLQEIEAKNTGAAINKAYFDDQLIALSKINGYPVRANDINVYQFVKMIKDGSRKD